MEEKQKLICDKCKVEMQELDAQFSYLGKSFRHKVTTCPESGQVSHSQELETGRMSHVESMMEDK